MNEDTTKLTKKRNNNPEKKEKKQRENKSIRIFLTSRNVLMLNWSIL